MIRRALLAALYLACSVAPCFCQEWASKMFKTAEHDFGTVARDLKAEFDFSRLRTYSS